jgi:hypothetical protein
MPYTVYQITCVCGAGYIGETKYTAHHRKNEHFEKLEDSMNRTNALALSHFTICCKSNRDNVIVEALHENILHYDNAMYLEAKLIFEKRNIDKGIFNG